MKHLIYKEMKLAMHPVCYVFTFVFPLLFLIPNYPAFISTFYIVPLFSILFLGANKGKQSNDLFYSVLLPVSKTDIVKARMFSLCFMEFGTIITTAILIPFKMIINNNLKIPDVGFGLNGVVSLFAFIIIGYAVINSVFLLMFYHSGRSIIAPTLISVIFYLIFCLIFTVILPMTVKGYYDFFCNVPIGYQFIYLLIALTLFAVSTYFTVKKAGKELEKIDL